MRDLKVLTGQLVVVSSDGATLRGVLESATRHFVALVEAHDVDRDIPAPLAGKVLIPTSRIKYVQVVN